MIHSFLSIHSYPFILIHSFCIHHSSPFILLHSFFSIHSSPFILLHSFFSIHSSPFIPIHHSFTLQVLCPLPILPHETALLPERSDKRESLTQPPQSRHPRTQCISTLHPPLWTWLLLGIDLHICIRIALLANHHIITNIPPFPPARDRERHTNAPHTARKAVNPSRS